MTQNKIQQLEQIGRRVKQLRRLLGKTPDQMANELEMDVKILTAFEEGKVVKVDTHSFMTIEGENLLYIEELSELFFNVYGLCISWLITGWDYIFISRSPKVPFEIHYIALQIIGHSPTDAMLEHSINLKELAKIIARIHESYTIHEQNMNLLMGELKRITKDFQTQAHVTGKPAGFNPDMEDQGTGTEFISRDSHA